VPVAQPARSKGTVMINCNETIPNMQSLYDLQSACNQHMIANGLESLEPIVADGNIHRYSTGNKKNKRTDEWYIAYEGISDRGNQYLTCAYGSWITGNKYVFKSWTNNNCFDKEDRKKLNEMFKRKQQETAKQLSEQHDTTAKKATAMWSGYAAIVPSDDYLCYSQHKGIKPTGAKFGLNPTGYPSVIIDIKNIEGEIRSLQYISMDANNKSYKTFLTGGEIKGNFHTIGTISDDAPIFVTEGYATGLSVYEATANATVVVLSAHGLINVVEHLKNKYPNSIITIAGDCDKVGFEKAHIAAKKFGCKVVIPVFPDEHTDEDENLNNKSKSDFNDLHQLYGLVEVEKQLLNAVCIPSAQDDLKKLVENIPKKKDPCENFCLSDLPPILGNYISSICETTNAHPIMVTSSVLATISAFLGKRIFIPEGEYFQTLYSNLWLLNIAKSGLFKSTALNKGARLAWKKSAEITSKIKELEAKRQEANNEEEKRDIKNAILKISRENILLPSKITAEALLEYLSQDHYGVILASEFGGWLQNLEKSHNNDLKAIFTELYDVPQSFRYKTKTQGDCILTSPYFSICGVSTLAWLKPSLKASDVASGFFARFLIFAPPAKDFIPPALPTQKMTIYPQAEQEVCEVLECIDEPRSYKLSKSARYFFEGLHKEIYKIHKSYSERSQVILEPYLKRWSPYLLKLAMIMQLFENPETREIGENALNAALAILLPAMRSTAFLFDGELGESDYQRKCRLVFEWICKKTKTTGAAVTRQAVLASKQLGGGVQEYDPILQMLIESGKLECKEKSLKN
jgi:phage/plasmid primase-like uncharacterized protein